MNNFTFHRTKFLIVAISFMFSGLAVLRFGFSVPANFQSGDGNSVTIIKNVYYGLSDSHFAKASAFNAVLNEHKLKEIVYDASEENYWLPKNANLKR